MDCVKFVGVTVLLLFSPVLVTGQVTDSTDTEETIPPLNYIPIEAENITQLVKDIGNRTTANITGTANETIRNTTETANNTLRNVTETANNTVRNVTEIVDDTLRIPQNIFNITGGGTRRMQISSSILRGISPPTVRPQRSRSRIQNPTGKQL
jgi:hypothetical protein